MLFSDLIPCFDLFASTTVYDRCHARTRLSLLLPGGIMPVSPCEQDPTVWKQTKKVSPRTPDIAHSWQSSPNADQELPPRIPKAGTTM